MSLIVAGSPLAGRTNESCRVIDRSGIAGARIRTNRAGDGPGLRGTRCIAERFAKARIVGEEWRRGLGPNDEINLWSVRSGLHTQLGELVQRLLKITGRPVGRHGDI